MTDKEIRALIERRMKDWRYGNSVEAKYKAEECDDILELIDSLHEEPKFKVGDIIKHKHYEHWETEEVIEVTAQGVRTNIGWLSFPDEWELVEEPKKKEPVSGNIDFEQELYKTFGQVKDFTLGMKIAKWFYDIGKDSKESQEPVSEGLEEAAQQWYDSTKFKSDLSGTPIGAFKEGASWKKDKMMKDAVDATVHIDAGGYPYIPQIELYDYDKDVPLAKEGDKYKVILIKENKDE